MSEGPKKVVISGSELPKIHVSITDVFVMAKFKPTKQRTLTSVNSAREFVHHCLLGLLMTRIYHGVLPPKGYFVYKLNKNRALDLTDYKNEFLKDPANAKRLHQNIIYVFIMGVARTFEAAEDYFKYRGQWYNKKKWENLYVVAGQIRNMAVHNFIWSFYPRWVKGLQKNKGSFPLKRAGISIEKSWEGKKAISQDLDQDSVVQIINDIYDDIATN